MFLQYHCDNRHCREIDKAILIDMFLKTKSVSLDQVFHRFDDRGCPCMALPVLTYFKMMLTRLSIFTA